MKNSDRYLALFLELLWRRECDRLDPVLDDAYDEFLESLWYKLTPAERDEVEAVFSRVKAAEPQAGPDVYEPELRAGDRRPPHLPRAA